MNLSVKKSVTLLTIAVFLLSLPETKAQLPKAENDTLTQSVLIHPVIQTNADELIFSREHMYEKQLGLGDQLARDFAVVTSSKEGLIQFYKNDGKDNKDYISWRKNVMAPVSGTVVLVSHPDTTNIPGQMNRDAEPGRVYIQNKDGVTVTLVHVREIKVEEGQQVKAGEVVAKVGNNGNSTGPHTHVGAWKGKTPLQIQVDLYVRKRK